MRAVQLAPSLVVKYNTKMGVTEKSKTLKLTTVRK
jgi:hypothetical protein